MKAKIDMGNKNPKPVKYISSLEKGDVIEYEKELYICTNKKYCDKLAIENVDEDNDLMNAVCINDGTLVTFNKHHIKKMFLCEIVVSFVRYVEV